MPLYQCQRTLAYPPRTSEQKQAQRNMGSSSFSSSYAEAREKFLAAATAAGATLSAHAHPERGPDGGALATDCAWIGPADAAAVLVLVSGTHGIEGYCGSGAQVDWLQRREAAQLRPGQAVLLVHALNPYGFAWGRRVTHENVDLNRNFIDFAAERPANPEYETLAAAAKPLVWDADSRAAALQVLADYARTNGQRALVQAVSGGQYTHADGIFFGGTGPTWSRRTLEAICRDQLAAATNVGFIDFHTGLGPEGYAEKITSARHGSAEHARVLEWYGLGVTSHASGDSVSASIAGDWLSAVPRLLPHARVTGIAMEYGTVDTPRVLDAVRADNWLHAHGEIDSPLGRSIKQQVRDAFYVDSDVWRGMVLGQSMVAVRCALAGLRSPGG